MLSKRLNKSTGSVNDHGCDKEDYKIENIQEYLNCSKTVFERRLTEQMKKSSFDDFILHQSIGEGAFGRVILVQHKSDENAFFAMKVMKKEHILRKNQLQNVLNEKTVLSAIRHPFIIHMEFYATNICHIYFIMPFIVGGDLFTLLNKRSSMDEVNAKFYAGQMVLALEYLHMLDIIHRDLKPENVLISKDGFIKLSDLGLSKRISKITRTMCGTPQYIAPEVILLKPYGKSVDWWSLGIVMFEMVAGVVPFYDENQKKLFKKIVNGIYKTPDYFTDNFSDIISQLLQTDSKKRYGSVLNEISDIKLHRWFETTDWIALYNKNIKAPFKPIYNGPSDTINFEKFDDENIEKTNFQCSDVDQKYFENF